MQPSWDFDVCWRRWAIGVEWGEGYWLVVLGPLTIERYTAQSREVLVEVVASLDDDA